MLIMLQHSEISVDHLLGVFKYYNKNKAVYNNLLRKVRTEIEKEHKIEKAKKQREEQIAKLANLKQQVEERNNKIYFKSRRKIDSYFKFALKKERKDDNDKDRCKDPLFSDFMYDILDNN